MFSSYHNVRALPIRNFSQRHKKRMAVGYAQPTDGIYLILQGKTGKVFSNLFLIGCR